MPCLEPFGSGMKRREFITLLGGTAATWTLAARAQQRAAPVIGFLSGWFAGDSNEYLAYFRQGLAETGYIEGQNVTIVYRWAEGNYDKVPALVADLVRRQVTAIAIPNTTTSAVAAKAATQTIPIIFLIGADPVKIGLVASLNRPGGNLTGINALQTALVAKRLELLHELMPATTRIAFLVNPTNRAFAEADTREAQEAARVLGLNLLVLNASSQSEIDAAFAKLVLERAGALVTNGESFFMTRSNQLAVLAARHAVPAIYAYRENALAGGLMSYGSDLLKATRELGIYTGRILKGEKPADLPVQQSAKVELIVNLKTAKALGVTVPLSLLGRADEVIE
jgi:putative tryptophan/tyrosine transport system substrate-binding protein